MTLTIHTCSWGLPQPVRYSSGAVAIDVARQAGRCAVMRFGPALERLGDSALDETHSPTEKDRT